MSGRVAYGYDPVHVLCKYSFKTGLIAFCMIFCCDLMNHCFIEGNVV